MAAFSKLMAATFALLLSKPFPEWKAFKLGLINEKGEVIQKPTTPEENNALGTFENLIRKIKKILIKYIPDSRLLGFLISAYLLKSESNEVNSQIIFELDEKLIVKEREIVYSTLQDIVKYKYN